MSWNDEWLAMPAHVVTNDETAAANPNLYPEGIAVMSDSNLDYGMRLMTGSHVAPGQYQVTFRESEEVPDKYMVNVDGRYWGTLYLNWCGEDYDAVVFTPDLLSECESFDVRTVLTLSPNRESTLALVLQLVSLSGGK